MEQVMNKTIPLKYNQTSIEYWAERKIMADAVDRCKSWRKANPFSYADWAVARRYFNITEADFVAQRDAYLANNSMKFSASTKTLWRA